MSFCIKTSRLDDEWKKYSKIKYKVRLCSFNMLNHSDNFINSKIANIQMRPIGEILNKNLNVKDRFHEKSIIP